MKEIFILTFIIFFSNGYEEESQLPFATEKECREAGHMEAEITKRRIDVNENDVAFWACRIEEIEEERIL